MVVSPASTAEQPMAVITYMGRKKNTAMFENMQKKLAMPKLKV